MADAINTWNDHHDYLLSSVGVSRVCRSSLLNSIIHSFPHASVYVLHVSAGETAPRAGSRDIKHCSDPPSPLWWRFHDAAMLPRPSTEPGL